MPKCCLRSISPLVLILVALLAQGADAAEFQFGVYERTLTDLGGPSAVAIDRSGVIWIAESDFNRISRVRRDGTALPPLALDLLRPAGLTVSADGLVFVVDRGNDRVVVLDGSGVPQRTWGKRGNGPGTLCRPTGIAVRGDRVAVADTGNRRVQIYDRNGLLIQTLPGPDGPPMQRPIDVAFADDGRLLVADAGANRVLQFNETGQLIADFGTFGPFDGLLDEPTAITSIGARIAVIDRRNHRVQEFDREGTFLRRWGAHAIAPREGEGALHYPDQFAIAPDASFAVLCESFEDRCQIVAALEPGAEPPDTPPGWVFKGQQVHFGQRIAVDGQLLAIAEPETQRAHIMEMSKAIPIVVGNFGERGDTAGLLGRTSGLAMDTDLQQLFFTDVARQRLQRFHIEWAPGDKRAFVEHRVRFEKSFDLAYLTQQLNQALTDDAKFSWVLKPVAVRLIDGDLLFLDRRNRRVVHLAGEDLALLGQWGQPSTPGWSGAVDLAIDRDGTHVAVVDELGATVEVYRLDGTRTMSITAAGDQPLIRPFGVVFDKTGGFYVSDRATHQVHRFDATGDWLLSFGTKGIDHGQLWKPCGLAIDGRGRILVVDWGNHRGQIFDADGNWLVTFGTGRAYTRDDQQFRRLRRDEEREP